VLNKYFSHFSYRKLDIEHLLTLTDSFTWDELPTRDPDTGYLTNAGYIPFNQILIRNAAIFGYVHHLIQSTVKIVVNHETIFPVWLPIDATRNPVYGFIIAMQVCSHCYVN